MGSEIFLDPPVRGRYSYAFIPLKEGAAPTQKKPFRMHRERGEAHKRVTQDWIDRGYLEPPVPVQSMDGNVVNKGGVLETVGLLNAIIVSGFLKLLWFQKNRSTFLGEVLSI